MKSMFKSYKLRQASITAIIESIPGACVTQEPDEVLIRHMGKLREFSPQLINQLPNKSVIDYVLKCFDIPPTN
jgi:hypothetical protein